LINAHSADRGPFEAFLRYHAQPEGRIASVLTSRSECPRRVPLVTHRVGQRQKRE
jgi:hypothetical protein